MRVAILLLVVCACAPSPSPPPAPPPDFGEILRLMGPGVAAAPWETEGIPAPLAPEEVGGDGEAPAALDLFVSRRADQTPGTITELTYLAFLLHVTPGKSELYLAGATSGSVMGSMLTHPWIPLELRRVPLAPALARRLAGAVTRLGAQKRPPAEPTYDEMEGRFELRWDGGSIERTEIALVQRTLRLLVGALPPDEDILGRGLLPETRDDIRRRSSEAARSLLHRTVRDEIPYFPELVVAAAGLAGFLGASEAEPELRALLARLPVSHEDRHDLHQAWIRLRLSHDPEVLDGWAREEGRGRRGSFDFELPRRVWLLFRSRERWALGRLAVLDPPRAAEILGVRLKTERDWRARDFLATMGRLDPERALAWIEEHAIERPDIWAEAFRQVAQVAGSPAEEPLARLLLEVVEGDVGEGVAGEDWFDAARVLLDAEVEREVVVRRLVEVLDGGTDQAAARAGTELGRIGETSAFDRMIRRDVSSRYSWGAYLGALVLLAEQGGEADREKLLELIRPHLVRTDRPPSGFLWQVWSADLRELKEALVPLSAKTPEEGDAEWSWGTQDPPRPTPTGLQLPRKILLLWREEDPARRALLLAAFAIHHPEILDPRHPDLSARWRRDLAIAGTSLKEADRGHVRDLIRAARTSPHVTRRENAAFEALEREILQALRAAPRRI